MPPGPPDAYSRQVYYTVGVRYTSGLTSSGTRPVYVSVARDGDAPTQYGFNYSSVAYPTAAAPASFSGSLYNAFDVSGFALW